MSSFSGIKNTLLAEQSDEEAAPAHDPNLKNSKAPERYAPGPAVIFYGKKSCFPGRCGTYFLPTGSAVTTTIRSVTVSPSSSTILQSAVPM